MRNHLGVYKNVAVTASYRCPNSQQHDLPTLISNALREVISRHACLCMVVVDEHTAEPYFARIPTIDLQDVIFFAKRESDRGEGDRDHDLEKILQDEHNRPFKLQEPPLPFWRLVVLTKGGVLSEFTATFCFHHSLADSRSAVLFHESLLMALSQVSSEMPTFLVRSAEKDLLPPLEVLHSLPTTEVALVHVLEAHRNPPVIPDNVWSGAIQSLPVNTCVRLLSIHSEDTSRFIAACKAKQTTVTATLQTLVASVLFSILPEQYTCLYSDGAISIRNILPSWVSQNEMGCFVNTSSEIHQRQGFSWQEAQRCRKTIQDVLSHGDEDMPIAFLKFVQDWNDLFLSQMGKKRHSAFELSNIGLVKVASEGPPLWQLDQVVFSQSACATSDAFRVSVATGPDGMLNFAFTWQEGVVEETFMFEIIDRVKSRLAALTKIPN